MIRRVTRQLASDLKLAASDFKLESIDLYITSRAGPQGEFPAPVRLAEPVSSEGVDLAGSLSADGCVLYFTSDRPGGFGMFDVYAAKKAR